MAPCACRAILPVSNDSLRPPISKLTCSNILHILFPGSSGATIRETSLGICDLLKKLEEQPPGKGNRERERRMKKDRACAQLCAARPCRPASSPTTLVCAEESAACAAAQGICATCAN